MAERYFLSWKRERRRDMRKGKEGRKERKQKAFITEPRTGPEESLWSLYFPSLCPPALWYLGTIIPPPSPNKSFSLLLSQHWSSCISMPDHRRSQDWDIQHLACQNSAFWPVVVIHLWDFQSLPVFSPVLFPSSLSTWLSPRPHEPNSVGSQTVQCWFKVSWPAPHPHPSFLCVLLTYLKVPQCSTP
jgi:hypothetical protein